MTDHELTRRMDKQDEMLLEIRDKINIHIAESDNMRPALEELVSMWRGSKLIIPIMSGMSAFIWAIWSWGKDHIK